jgi:predicted nucleic acid-binding protein
VIVLDTNVVCELVRPRPSGDVIAWVDAQLPWELWLTSITAAELQAGAALLPAGKRRAAVVERVDALIGEMFAGFVLPFDVECSTHYAAVVAARTRKGLPISAFDAAIAAICRQNDAVLATRNTRDFAGTEVRVIDPWSAG